MCNLIDDWETRPVNENLVHGLGSGILNHYQIVKNMMGSLMEEMIGTWNHTRSYVLQAKSKILELDTVITHKDVMTAWKKLAMGLDSTGDWGYQQRFDVFIRVNERWLDSCHPTLINSAFYDTVHHYSTY